MLQTKQFLFMGGDSEFIDLGHGWDGMYSVYLGYNASRQTYDGVGIYQNGGNLGASFMAYKGNFFTGLTANVGENGVQANTQYGSDNFGMLMAGVASKTGYNFELGKNDKVDSSMLAQYVFLHNPPRTPKLPETIKKFRSLVRYKETLIESRTQEIGRLKSSLDSEVKN